MSDQNQPSKEIKNFTPFLEECLNKKVLQYTLRPLTKPGDNYGAFLQSVEVKLPGNDGFNEEDVIQLVAKTVVLNPGLGDMFKQDFVREIRFYTDIIPAVEQFERIANVPEAERLDIFIRCLGSRISLNPNAETADTDAVLLLENVKFQNFENANRYIGLDADETCFILKNLAKFHALCIAMRLREPSLFNSKVIPHIESFPFSTEENVFKAITRDFKLLTNLSSELRATVENIINLGYQYLINKTPTSESPYTTVIHRDLWINNIMLKKDSNETHPLKIKIYDFQFSYYQSFAFDLIFFLFTSVRSNDLKKSFTSIVDHYILEFLKTLDSLKCLSDDYTFDKMWEEIRKTAKFELFRLMYRTKTTLAVNKTEPALTDATKNFFHFEDTATQPVFDHWKLMIDIFDKNGFF